MGTFFKGRRNIALMIGGILAAALLWKALLLAFGAFPFNADEAIVGLMARHILQGERPIFFYGQAYMGSLDAFLVAGGFVVFGQQVWVIRVIQALLYGGLIISTIAFGKEVFGNWRVGMLAGALMVIPTVNVTLYTTASLGGYGEALLLGNLILLVSLHIVNSYRNATGKFGAWPWWLLLGSLAGLGMWANGLTLIFSVPAGFALIVCAIRYRKQVKPGEWAGLFLAATAGFIVGSLPWWIFAFSQGFNNLVFELLGSAVAVEQDPWLVRIGNHLVNYLLLGGTALFGFRPPWEIRWLGLPLLPFVLIFWAVALVFWFRRSFQSGDTRWGRALINGSLAVLSAGFIFTSFGVDPSGRYFLPFAMPLAFVAADLLLTLQLNHYKWAILFSLILVYQAWGTLDSAFRNPPGITTQFSAITQVDTRYQGELIEFLKSQGEMRGYTNYWVAYPTAFLSDEELIFLPRLPYHEDLRYTPRDDRYMPYQDRLATATKAAYITTLNPALDQKLVEGFLSAGLHWQEKWIGDYHIFYQLSRLIRPDELGLGLLR